MLAVIRAILIVIFFLFIFLFGVTYCLFSPCNPRHVAKFSRWFSFISSILGIKVEVRRPEDLILPQNCVYISNHQNNYDVIAAGFVVQPRTVTIGKKSLLWIPLFGFLYWITGNLIIDRNNSTRAYSTLFKIVRRIKKRNISIWIFPEGTRSRGRGLLPFKTGAFYAAISAGIPIVPICVSNTSNKIKFNRWSNGLVIIEILPPVKTINYSLTLVRNLAEYCQLIMKNKLDELNEEVTKRESLEH